MRAVLFLPKCMVHICRILIAIINVSKIIVIQGKACIMNDKQIRNILISYLKSANDEIRIYQEKSIGNSVCDLMMVTDDLCGFEIKSDLDNYSRLQSQIPAYNRFFDKNYIVVGESHQDTIGSQIPNHWGIIVINGDSVEVKKDAETNHSDIRSQLNLLWKLELKNLLIKTNMPLYTYKSKEYIIDQIVDSIDRKTIHKHVVYELLHRDYSIFGAEDYTIYSDNSESSSGAIHNIPAQEIVDTLSEQNLEKLTLDQWITLYHNAKELRLNKDKVYQCTENPRVPHKIPYTDIEAVPGVPWINKRIICEFIYYLSHGKECNGIVNTNCVNYEPTTGHWHINNKISGVYYGENAENRTLVEYTYGTPRYNAYQILEAMLNLREIKIYDYNNKFDEKATLAALEKQSKIEQLFKDWIWKDEDRRWAVEEAYNHFFGQFSSKEYDGSKLEFPDLSESVTLYEYQKNAVQKIISEKNTLLAYEVGMGKTYIMIAAAMIMRQNGQSRKNMFVVPNHIVGQWEIIFKTMYPNAKVLAIEPRMFKPEMRMKVLSQIRDGDYDGIIIAYSCFDMIPISSQIIINQMNKHLEEINRAIKRSHYESGSYASLMKESDHIRKQASEMIKAMSNMPNEITFDDLEINTLFVDEAHNFKNIEIQTKLRNLRGINTKGSQKCQEMLCKAHIVQEQNGGRGVVFATGTPLCNSISDAYAMQMYLQYDKLHEMHLDVFDNWVKTFAKPERVCEIDVNASGYRFVLRFSKFYNLPELSSMFSDIAIFNSIEQEKDIPLLNGYDNICIAKSPELASYMKSLCDRTEKIRSKDVDRTKDNMLKVSTDGRKAALDLRLVGTSQPDDESSKINRCIDNVISVYNECNDNSQIIFCDVSTPGARKEFNIYEILKSKLLSMGIPKREIAFIHNYSTEEQKVNLFERVNKGEVRILIGSTFKLGTGANVQTKLKAIHHLDVPWRPSDMVQREGRILRKGNTNDFIRIFRYISQGSFDAYSWQLLETKQKFISQFLSGTYHERCGSDLDENVLTYAQVKALAISNPEMRELAEKQNELNRIMILSREFSEQKQEAEEKCTEAEERLLNSEKSFSATCDNEQYLESISDIEFQTAYQNIKGLLSKQILFREKPMEKSASFLEFEIGIPMEQKEDKPYITLERNGELYYLIVGSSESGNARRISNYLKSFHKQTQYISEQIKKIKDEISNYQTIKSSKNPYSNQIIALQNEINLLQGRIKE